jgi:hypothetical protein
MEKVEEKLLEYLNDKPNYEKFKILHNEMGYDFDFIKKLYPKELKTFSDLKFGKHGNSWMVGAIQAILNFDNGHFVSVVGGGNGLYGDGVKTFEVGFPLPGDSIDVEGWLSPEEVTTLMINIQMKEPYGTNRI